MKCAVVQFDTRSDHEFQELVSQNIEYCQHAGYDHKMFIGKLEDMTPYWAKVDACLAVAETGEYDAILFVDTDAVVMDFGLRIEDVLPGDAVLAFSGVGGMANAGVFAVRCNDRGVSLLRDWMSHYKSDDWNMSEGRWACRASDWAGEGYEQEALNKIVIPNHSGYVADVGWEGFLHCDHFRKRPDELCVPDFQRFVLAMRKAKVVHFCRSYKCLAPVRHRAKAGKIALFDERAPNVEEAMKEAKRICQEGQM